MAHSSHYSNSPPLSPRSPSPEFSSSSDKPYGGYATWADEYYANKSASRGSSSVYSDDEGVGGVEDQEAVDSVICQWENCGRPFSHLPTLITHIHNEHIGVHKSNYTCEWATCIRRGIQQASRFALISHIRAHTGEKPFTCPLPECDKSFTRSDAMAKHMRLQHNISPPLPGRGGNRKRKRDDGADAQTPTEGQTNAWDEGRISPPLEEHGDYFSQRRSASPGASSNASIEEDSIADLPEYLRALWNPATNKILDRSPSMVRYLLMKSKHRFVLEQHENLLEELRVVREHEKVAREEKERALDRVLRTELGAKAEFLINPIDKIPSQQPHPTLAMEQYPAQAMNGGTEPHPL